MCSCSSGVVVCDCDRHECMRWFHEAESMCLLLPWKATRANFPFPQATGQAQRTRRHATTALHLRHHPPLTYTRRKLQRYVTHMQAVSRHCYSRLNPTPPNEIEHTHKRRNTWHPCLRPTRRPTTHRPLEPSYNMRSEADVTAARGVSTPTQLQHPSGSTPHPTANE